MIGDIHFYSDNGWLGKCIKFFTKSKYTHVAIEVGELHELHTETLVFESYLTQQFGKIGNPIKTYRINASNETILDALDFVIDKYYGKPYGFGQLLWFIWRWFLELLGFDSEKVRKMENWFPNSNICSELATRFMLVCAEVEDIHEIQAKWTLRGWNINSIAPSDLDLFLSDLETVEEINETA